MKFYWLNPSLFIGCLIFVLVVEYPVYADSSRNMIEHWVARSIANRASLDEFVCEYEVAVGLAGDEDSCDLTDVFAFGSGIWACRRTNQSLVFNADYIEQIEYDGGSKEFPMSGREVVMHSKAYQFRLGAISGARVRNRTDQQLISDHCPFSNVGFLGSDTLYAPMNFMDLEDSTFEAAIMPDGKAVASFNSKMEKGVGIWVDSTSQVTFDPSRNFLVTEVSFDLDDDLHLWRVVDSVEGPNGGYFPTKICMTRRKCKKGNLFYRWQTTSLVFEEPTDEQLTYRFTDDITISPEDSNDETPRWVNRHPGETVSPMTLHELMADVDAGMRLVHNPDASRRRNLIWTVVAIAIAVGVGTFIYRRKFSHS